MAFSMVLAVSFTAAAEEEASAEALLDAARTRWKRRAQVAQAKSAVNTYEKAVEAGAGYEAMWEGARAVYYLGEFPMENASRDSRIALFERGKRLAQLAVKANPNGAEGHFWLGSLIGVWGTARGVLKSLSVHGDVRREGETAMKINQSVECGGAYRLLGRYYHALPSISGGDEQRSVKLLQKGVGICPTNDLGRYYLADTLHALDRDAEAREQLEAIINSKNSDPRFAPEHPFMVRRAKSLLEDL
jgi:hypothetical protein